MRQHPARLIVGAVSFLGCVLAMGAVDAELDFIAALHEGRRRANEVGIIAAMWIFVGGPVALGGAALTVLWWDRLGRFLRIVGFAPAVALAVLVASKLWLAQ